jgi:L-ascorbate metabolism protein UlaG (beta-lactamase superfamily)
MLFIFFIFCSIILIGILFFQRKTFGAHPSGKRQTRIEHARHYKHGAFQNASPTQIMLKEASFFRMLFDFFNKPKTTVPDRTLPSIKTDLIQLEDHVPSVVWFGHSSYLIKYQGKTILVDPVFSGNASPVSFFAKAFEGTDVYHPHDFTTIDLLILTHDHYDHLDYKTIVTFKDKVKKVYTPLGVGAHLEHWGYNSNAIVELDWWDTHQVIENIKLTATPARHFSGRGFKRGKTLWASFVLQMNQYTIFIGGDSGYDTHFKTIGEKFGPFDLVLLEAGQYGKNWPYIHMLPEQTVQASLDLNAKVLFPVHWGKFALAFHAWDEPIEHVLNHATAMQVKVTTPMIGEVVRVTDLYPTSHWWRR